MVVIAMNKIKTSLVSFLIFRALPVFLCGVSFGDVKKIICLVIFFVIYLDLFSYAAGETKKTAATGMSAIHNNFVDIARDKAIDNALRNAVEKIVGVMVTSNTEVENFQLKLDRVLSESKGFVDSYKILLEKREGDNYEVAVEAEVTTGKLEDRMKAVELIMTRKAKPRVMIVFSEQAQKDAIAEAAISQYLLSKGFKLVDANTVNKNRGDLNLSPTGGSEKILSGLAQRYGAEVVIAGSVEMVTNTFSFSGTEVFTNKVNVSLKVINSDTGSVITTDSECNSAPGAKGDIRAIIESAVKKLSKKVLDNTLDHWSSELTNTITVKLIVLGLDDYEQLLIFKENLSLSVKGFKVLYQRSYQRGEADIDLEVKGDVQGLADDLAALKIKEKKLQILEMTPNRIAVKLM